MVGEPASCEEGHRRRGSGEPCRAVCPWGWGLILHRCLRSCTHQSPTLRGSVSGNLTSRLNLLGPWRIEKCLASLWGPRGRGAQRKECQAVTLNNCFVLSLGLQSYSLEFSGCMGCKRALDDIRFPHSHFINSPWLGLGTGKCSLPRLWTATWSWQQVSCPAVLPCTTCCQDLVISHHHMYQCPRGQRLQ